MTRPLTAASAEAAMLRERGLEDAVHADGEAAALASRKACPPCPPETSRQATTSTGPVRLAESSSTSPTSSKPNRTLSGLAAKPGVDTVSCKPTNGAPTISRSVLVTSDQTAMAMFEF